MTDDLSTPPAHAIDIGDGHKIVFADYAGEKAGIDEWHLKPNGEWCHGWVSFNGRKWLAQFTGKPGWDVLSEDPLTLQPSILCRACGSHGHITNGKWVPA